MKAAHLAAIAMLAAVVIAAAMLFYTTPIGQTGKAVQPFPHVHAIAYAGDALLLGTHNGVFRSFDLGKTFEPLAVSGYFPADDVMAFAVDPRNTMVVYAAGHDLGVVKSEDGGVSWKRADIGVFGTDIHALALSPKNPDFVYVFSVDNGVFRSKDGGLTWKRMDDGPENPGVRAFAYAAVQTDMDKSMNTDNWGLLLAGTSGGLFQSFSCFCGWTKTTSEFDATTIYSLAAEGETLYAATKDGLFKSADLGKGWEKLSPTGRFAAVATDPLNPSRVFAATEDAAVWLSDDAGASWTRQS
jgi:photosystem II stability/assembly factor-like uncharacterized protein